MSEKKIRIGIGLCTYKRVEGLRRALQALARLHIPEGVSLHVWVGDGDGARSGYKVTVAAATFFPYSLCYEAVPLGRVAARNAVLRTLLRENMDYIAFCDDDAEVAPGWIKILYRALKEQQADVVTDYVKVRFATHVVPKWLSQHAEELLYICPLRAPQRVSFARTGNVLFAAAVAQDLRFDSRFDGSGEDTHFFLRVHMSGARIVGLAAYSITETWPSSRASFAFLWRRHYAIGLVSSFIAKDVQGVAGLWRSLLTAIQKAVYAPLHPLWAYGRSIFCGKRRSFFFFLAQGAFLWARSLGHFRGFFK